MNDVDVNASPPKNPNNPPKNGTQIATNPTVAIYREMKTTC